jgi:hypothetical protein
MCRLTHRNIVKFVKRVFGEKDFEAVLQRLDRLTQDEARTIVAQIFEVIYSRSRPKYECGHEQQANTLCL